MLAWEWALGWAIGCLGFLHCRLVHAWAIFSSLRFYQNDGSGRERETERWKVMGRVLWRIILTKDETESIERAVPVLLQYRRLPLSERGGLYQKLYRLISKAVSCLSEI